MSHTRQTSPPFARPRVLHVPPPLDLEPIFPPKVDLLPLFTLRQSCRSLQEYLDSGIADRSDRDAGPLEDVYGVVAHVSIVELRGGDIRRRSDCSTNEDGRNVTDDTMSSWGTRIEVSIPSVQSNASPVAISDMSVLETYVLSRKMLIVPGSK